jgi:solute carrier family 50 protein (sugar transporter)
LGEKINEKESNFDLRASRQSLTELFFTSNSNLFSWVTYAILKQNLFVFFGNAPGFVMSVWLNLQAVKLQYESFRSQEMRKSIVAAIEQARESFGSSVLELQEQQLLTDEATHSTTPESTTIQSFVDAARIVRDVTAQNMVAPAPHDTMVMANVLLWLSVIATISFGSAFPDRTKELIVGVIVNLNLVIFYGSPLSTIWTVLITRSASTIHIPTMLTGTLNGTFWAAYGVAVLDPFIAVPNSLGALLGVVQMILCILFPRNKETGMDDSPADSERREYSATPRMDEEAQPNETSKRGFGTTTGE